MPTEWQAVDLNWTSPWVDASTHITDWLLHGKPLPKQEPDPTPPTFQSAAEADAWLEAHPAVRRE